MILAVNWVYKQDIHRFIHKTIGKSMEQFLLASLGALSTLGLGIATVSLLIHWKRPQIHPDVSQVQAEITALRTEYLDLLDRVEHWMKRDKVRRVRQGKEDAEADAQPSQGAIPIGRAQIKAQLRSHLRAQQVGP